KATAEEKHRAVVLYTVHHLTIEEAAVELGRSYAAVWGWLSAAGVPHSVDWPGARLTGAEKRTAVDLYTEQGLSSRAGGVKLGKGCRAVRGCWHDARVVRPPGRTTVDGDRPPLNEPVGNTPTQSQRTSYQRKQTQDQTSPETP